MFEKNHSLSTKTTSKEDENCTRLKSRTGFSGLDRLADLHVDLLTLCFYEFVIGSNEGVEIL